MQHDSTTKSHQYERYTVFGFGVLFLIVILVLTLWIPTPTIAQFFVFRLILALAAAGTGALIPGFIELRQPLPNKGLLRAGGALALFTIIWFGNPGKLAIEGIAPPPKEDARLLIEHSMSLIDKGAYEDAYKLYSSSQRALRSYQTFTDLIRNVRKPLGSRIKGPQLYGANSFDEYMGNKGPFVAHTYLSRFENQTGVWAEEITVIAEDGNWKMYGHIIAPCEKPNCTVPDGF